MYPTFAIIIGVSEYPADQFEPLPAAEADAIALARALIHWGISEDHVTLLTGNVPKESLDVCLNQLAERKEPFQLLFYFCGHGYRTQGPTPESYLIFSEDGYNLEELLLKVGEFKTTHTYLFIDACHLRLNLVFNPKLKEEVEGTLHSNKSLFCILSSGIFPSYEDIKHHYGYFTQALIRGLSKLRKKNRSPTTLFTMIREELVQKELPEPEMYNMGTHQIDLFPSLDSSIRGGELLRPEVIAEIQDLLVQNPGKNIWMTGRSFADQLKMHSILLPLDAPLETRKRHELLLFDTPNPEKAKKVISQLKSHQLRAIFFSSFPFRSPDYISYQIPPLTDQEMALVLNQEWEKSKGYDIEAEKKAMAALYSCGFYLDEALFLKTFKIKTETMRLLEDLGLVFYEKEAYHPRNCLLEFVETNQLKLNGKATLSYWKQQFKKLPNNPRAAQSFIFTLKCFGYEPKLDATLKEAFELLSKDLNTLQEGAEIFLSSQIMAPSTLYLAETLMELGELKLAKQLLDIPSPCLSSHAKLLKIHLLWRTGNFEASLRISPKNLSIETALHHGIAHYFLGNWDEAIQNLSHVKEKTSQSKMIGWLECLLGTINGIRGVEIKKSTKQIESGIHHLLQSDTPEEAWVGWNNLGELRLNTGELRLATHALEKALEAAKKFSNPSPFLEVARNFLELELKANHPKALDWLDSIEEILPSLNEPTVAMQLYNTLAKVHLNLKNLTQARIYIKKAFPLTAPSKAYHPYTLGNIALYLRLRGLPQKSHHFLKQAQSLALMGDNQLALAQLEA